MTNRLMKPTELPQLLRTRVKSILNGFIACHNYNVESVYRHLLANLTVQLNSSITLLIETYVVSSQTLGSVMLRRRDGYVISRVSERIIEVYTDFVSRFNRALQIIKIYLLQLEKILAIHGWHLVYTLILLRGFHPPPVARIILDHVKRITVTSKSDTWEYTDRLIKKVFDPIISTIVNHIRDMSWLENYLFCSDRNSPEDRLQTLEDEILTNHFPEIYKTDKIWYFGQQ